MTIGIFAFALLAVAIYPLFKDSLEEFDDGSLEGFLGATDSLASPEGYLQSQVLIFTPVLVVIMAIITGTAAFVGEQDAGTLDIVLAQPITRRRLALEKVAALSVTATVASAAHWPGVMLGALLVDFDIGGWRMLGATVMTLPVSLVFLAASLLASAGLPTRATAAMTVTAAVVVAYFANIIGASSDSLEWVLWVSPFYWSDASLPLVDPFPWGRFAALIAVAVGMAAATVLVFERRDIAAGSREFSIVSLMARLRTPVRRPRQGQTE
jgi:ABC-2 type transport system permease protein